MRTKPVPEVRFPFGPWGVTILCIFAAVMALDLATQAERGPAPSFTGPREEAPPATPEDGIGAAPLTSEGRIEAVLEAARAAAAVGNRGIAISLPESPFQGVPPQGGALAGKDLESLGRLMDELNEKMAPYRRTVSAALRRLTRADLEILAAGLGDADADVRMEVLIALDDCTDPQIAAFAEAIPFVLGLGRNEASTLSTACTRAPSLKVAVLEALDDFRDDIITRNLVASLGHLEDRAGAVRLFGRLWERGCLALHDPDVLCRIGADSSPEQHREWVAASGCSPAVRRAMLMELRSGYEERDRWIPAKGPGRARIGTGTTR